MTCSKIFSGDLPELTYEVIKYFQNDYSTLHSCILVNRLWCRLAIPLLWENPFSIPTGNYNFIKIYSHNSNSDFKTKLIEYKIINSSSLPSNTLFNYPSFLKYLNINKIIFSVVRWFEATIRTSNPENGLNLGFNFNRDICVSLFKIFIENEVNLHTLEIEFSDVTHISTYFNNLNNICELILQNTNFIHNIRNINLFINNLFDSSYSDNNKYKLIENRISQIINLQQNLKKILIGSNSFPLYQSLLLSKESNCSNTLNTITFYKINFNFSINNILEQLNVLESIHIIYCSFNSNFAQQIINLTKPFKLKSLLINEKPQIEVLGLLLQKYGDYLENFEYVFNHDLSLNQQLLELIIKYCKNINFPCFNIYERLITYQILNLIENIKQNLNYLSINIWYDYNGKGGSSTILQNLGQILPSKLEYLLLGLHHIKADDFKVFLKNSHDTFIKKLLIYNSQGQDILPLIKKYIMKKKRVRYLAINNYFYESTFDRYGDNIKELISLKDEVKEFRLYNIEVQSYSGLVIDMHNYIKEIN
ncbi:hypothetical protein RhiirC2_791432 [Rhizophagus irregularis]|uniref:F-box domain-containing protein n=1 Tax=Rhizophagus irregularis TaxID=588596 RepID=A0A2N1MJ76_9GLOM|nr:hypothetical protein RhiirC2_791432 [Rhizophagus irregularis]